MLRLRERYAKLNELQRQLRGVGVSAEIERLQPADRDDRGRGERGRRAGMRSSSPATASGRTRSTTSSGCSTTSSSSVATAPRWTTRPSSPASAAFGARTVVLVGHQKGRDIHENVRRRFGMASPEGYRKAIRVMERGRPARVPGDLARRYARCVSRRAGRAARPGGLDRPLRSSRWRALSGPSVACVIGEGGSGGAVALAVADRVLMQENAIYSVISPEGCAAILWRDGGQAKKAAAALKPDARHCLDARRDRRDRARAAGAAPTSTTTRRPVCSGTALDEALSGQATLGSRTTRRRHRRREVPRDGRVRGLTQRAPAGAADPPNPQAFPRSRGIREGEKQRFQTDLRSARRLPRPP